MQRMAIALAILNALTFLLYGTDKAAARRGGNRVPENVLHLTILVNGAFLFWVFRH